MIPYTLHRTLVLFSGGEWSQHVVKSRRPELPQQPVAHPFHRIGHQPKRGDNLDLHQPDPHVKRAAAVSHRVRRRGAGERTAGIRSEETQPEERREQGNYGGEYCIFVFVFILYYIYIPCNITMYYRTQSAI